MATTRPVTGSRPHATLDDIENYVASFTDEEQRELAVAEAAIDIAIVLYRARERRGLTQADAARLAGLQQQAVSRLERPGANPQLGTVRDYLDALSYGLELNIVDLATGEPALTAAFPAGDRPKRA